MSFLAGLIPSVAKFGQGVLGDILSGKKVGQSLKQRGLEAVGTLPGIGAVAQPLLKEGIEALEKRGRRRNNQLVKKLGGIRLTPAGQQAAKLMVKRLVPNADEIIRKSQEANKSEGITGPMIIPKGEDGGGIQFNKFAESDRVKRDREERKEYAEKPKKTEGKPKNGLTSAQKKEGLKDWEEHIKWAKGFVRDQAEASGNNPKEIKTIEKNILKKNSWISKKPTDIDIRKAFRGNLPEVI